MTTTNHAEIAALIESAVADGILRPTSPMNGTGTDYVTVGVPAPGKAHLYNPHGEVFVGRLTKAQDGYQACDVYVDVTIAHMQGRHHETTEHDAVDDYFSISICGSTVTADSRRRGDIDGGGQNIDTVAMVPGIGKLVDVWKEYHLTDMTAGCAHQTPVYAPDTYGRSVPSLDLTAPCPVTGYRYGHAWLVRDLPASAVQAVLNTLRNAHRAAIAA